MILPACLTLALLATGASARADEDAAAPVARLTLAEALERARTHSARLAQYAALESAAEAGTQEARAGRLPQLDLSAGYTRLSSVPELTLVVPGPPPIRQTVFPDIQDTYRAHAGLTQSLYSGGRVGAGVDAADHRSDGRRARPRDRGAGPRARDDLGLLVPGHRARNRPRAH